MSLEDPVEMSWTENLTHLCYEEGDISPAFCGLKDGCSQKGMFLPLVFEQAWPNWFRIFVYLFGLLYRYLLLYSSKIFVQETN